MITTRVSKCHMAIDLSKNVHAGSTKDALFFVYPSREPDELAELLKSGEVIPDCVIKFNCIGNVDLVIQELERIRDNFSDIDKNSNPK